MKNFQDLLNELNACKEAREFAGALTYKECFELNLIFSSQNNLTS